MGMEKGKMRTRVVLRGTKYAVEAMEGETAVR